MKNALLIAFLLFSNVRFFSQYTANPKNNNSTEQKVTVPQDTSFLIIAKSRKMILENLYAGNLKETKRVAEYLNQKFNNSDYMPFWYAERFLISYCVKDYNFILEELITKANKPDYKKEKVIPPYDHLGNKMGEYLSDKSKIIEEDISSSGLDEEQRKVLILTLKFYIFHYGPDSFISQDELNAQADSLLKKYPNTTYKDFIKRDVRHVLKASEYAWGATYGGSAGVFTEELNKYFTPIFGLSFGLEIFYKLWYSNFHGNLSLTKVEEDFIFNGNWKKRTQLRYDMLGFSLGRILYEDRYVRFIPNFGLAFAKFSTQPEAVKKGEVDDLSLGYSPALLLRLNTDWKAYYYEEGPGFASYLIIRLSVDYMYNSFYKDDDKFSGNTLLFTMGIGIFGKPLVRDL